MLNNKKIIVRFSLQEKIQFLVNSSFFQTKNLGSLNLPKLSFTEEFEIKKQNEELTSFPSNIGLCFTWNDSLMEEIFKAKSFENSYFNKFNGLKLSLDINASKITEDPFLTTNLILNAENGLKINEGIFSLDARLKDNLNEDEIAITLGMLSRTLSKDVKFIIVNSFEEIKFIKERYKFEGIFLFVTDKKEEFIKGLNIAPCFNFTFDEQDMVKALYNSVVDYDNLRKELNVDLTPNSSFIKKEKDGEILSEEIIDRTIDIFISFLKYQSNVISQEHTVLPLNMEQYKHKDDSNFDLDKHKQLVKKVCDESIVLLKNDYSCLPLTSKDQVVLIGNGFSSDRQTNLFFEISKKQRLNVVGAFNAFDDQVDINPLSEERILEYENKSNAFVFNFALQNKQEISQAQIEFVRKIKELGKKVIGIIICDEYVELNEELFDAILYTANTKVDIYSSLASVLMGLVNPSGKLTKAYPKAFLDSQYFHLTPNYLEDGVYLYPFGYGLSYSTFEYHSLSVNRLGVSFTMVNSSYLEGSQVVQLYIRKANSHHLFANKILKGYTKVNLLPGESKKVTIPFDDFTFTYFDKKKKCLGIEKGQYEILIGEDIDHIKLEGTISLKEYYENNDDFNYLYQDDSVDTDKMENNNLEERGMSYKKKLALNIFLLVYVFLAGIFLIIYSMNNLSESNFIVSLIIIISLLVVIITSDVIYLVLCKKKDLKNKARIVKGNLSLMVDSIDKFVEFDKVEFIEEEEEEVPSEEELTFESPKEETDVNLTFESENDNVVKEEISPEENKEDLIAEENAVPTIKEESTLENTSLASKNDNDELEEDYFEFDDLDEEETNIIQIKNDFVKFDSLENLFSSLQEYLKMKGFVVEINSLRRLISSVLSSRIIIANSYNLDDLKELLEQISLYFTGNVYLSKAKNNYQSEQELLSDNPSLKEALNEANSNKDKLVISLITNVRSKNVNSYMKRFITKINRPEKKIAFKSNEGETLFIPNNLLTILVPSEEEFIDQASRALLNVSVFMPLEINRIAPSEEDISRNPISLSSLEEIVYQLKKRYYLSEDSYKKIDELEDNISMKEEFKLSNKSILQIETYSSLYTYLSSDDLDTLDNVLLAKVVPLIKKTVTYKKEEGDKFILSLFDKIIGESNFNRTQKYIAKVSVSTPFVIEENALPLEENNDLSNIDDNPSSESNKEDDLPLENSELEVNSINDEEGKENVSEEIVEDKKEENIDPSISSKKGE